VGRVFTLLVVGLFWACGLLLVAIPACQDDSVYRSGDVPPSIMDGGGTGGAPAGSDAGAD
jgi:hypothetical protein